MSLSSCPKCWDVLCECGHEYRDWNPQRLREFIKTLNRLVVEKEPLASEGMRPIQLLVELEVEVPETLTTSDTGEITLHIPANLIEIHGADGEIQAARVTGWTTRRVFDEGVDECQTCGEVLEPDDSYIASPCGSFCSECMLVHAQTCGICRGEFDLPTTDE